MRLSKFLFVLLFLSSCVEVGFKHPMPTKGKELTSIPIEIIKYYTEMDSISGESSKLSVTDIFEEGINDSLPENYLLKLWKGNYFLNQKEDSLWTIVMIRPTSKSTFDIYHLDGGNEKTIKLLKGITDVEEIMDEKGELELVILDPTLKEFKKITKSGAFEKVDIFN